jgi:hypothetical protein
MRLPDGQPGSSNDGSLIVRSLVLRVAFVSLCALAGALGWSTVALAAAPTVTDVSPDSGAAAGGTSVTIEGTGFVSGATVKFGEASATAVSVKSSTSLSATSPTGTGTINVTVTDSNGTSAAVSHDWFAYELAPSGQWLGKYGSLGSGEGQFEFAGGIAINKSAGDVYVGSLLNKRIEEFSTSGSFIRAFEVGALPGFLTVDASGDVWASGENKIREFTATGTLIREFGGKGKENGKFTGAAGLTFARGDLYVVDNGDDRIEIFSPEGAYLTQFSTGAATKGEFPGPWEIATDPVNGDLYVTIKGNDQVDAFTPTGTPIKSFGAEGSGPGQFEEPAGVAINTSGDLYVVDAANARVEEWAP